MLADYVSLGGAQVALYDSVHVNRICCGPDAGIIPPASALET